MSRSFVMALILIFAHLASQSFPVRATSADFKRIILQKNNKISVLNTFMINDEDNHIYITNNNFREYSTCSFKV